MAIVVQKYGGSSVADIAKLRAVADQIVQTKHAGDDVVVVVSAMGKTTDNLLALARQAAGDEDEPPRRELDMLLSTGERVSMALLSIAIQSRGLSAVSFTGSQSGIITNDRHFDARIIEVRPHRIEDELARGRIVIVAGYQGMSYRREITTLGRGGSDTTALALAAALGAVRAEIYSDVDGVYTADPRVVRDARHLPELDYRTMQEMAECGAKVLCAQAVEWAKKEKIAIHARKTGVFGAAADRETIVGPSVESGSARAVVAQRKIALVRVGAGELAALLELAERHGLPLGDVAIDAEAATLWAPLLNVPDWAEVRVTLERELSSVRIEDGLALASVVGVEIGSRPELVARALGTLGGRQLWLGSSALRLSAVVPDGDLDEITRRWHETFVAPAAAAQPSSRSPGSGVISPVSPAPSR